jgi:hypothetical protein
MATLDRSLMCETIWSKRVVSRTRFRRAGMYSG